VAYLPISSPVQAAGASMRQEPAAKPIRILELRSVLGSGGGPEKTILLGTARSDASQFQITVCYLRSAQDKAYELDQRARAIGVRYEEISERRSFDPAIWSQLTQITKHAQAQIVHSHDYKTDALAWFLGRRTAIKPLATAHGWTGHSTRERLLYYPFDRWLLARFPAVIAVSSDIKGELVNAGADAARVTVVLNGIDHRAFRRNRDRETDERARLGLLPREIAIGSVGRLEPQKRFDLLLKSFARIRQAVPNSVLLIAGEGSQHAALEQLRNELSLGHSCRLLGHVQDIGAFHHALGLFVQASDYEGTPNSVLEAMAFETPIVATTAGGTEEIVRHEVDGLLVRTGDVDGLAQAMTLALSETEHAASWAASARERVETELSFETRMRRVEEIYLRLAGAS
jgi:glycosyltransferase involved in cell wall biosynthesis